MIVKVRFFAGIRDVVGRPELRMDVPEGATAEHVWTRLAAEHPGLAARRAGLAAAVNRRYAGFDTTLGDGDEVVFVPPVSGG